jgi:hypothetical protein
MYYLSGFHFFMLRDFTSKKKKIEILFLIYAKDISTNYNNMSAISNNTILADNEPSVCIPRVFANIDRKRIHNVFQTIFGPDVVSQIDMVSKVSETGEEYSRVFVHFTKWPKTMYAQQVRQKLLNGDKVKVVYDEPWYWYMSASRVERPQTRAREVSAPYIDLDGGDASSSSTKERVQRDVPPLVPRQVSMKGGAGYEHERSRHHQHQDTRKERNQEYDHRYHHHQEREQQRERHHYPEDRRYNDRYENDSYKTRGNDYYAHDSRRPSQHYREDYTPRYDEDQRQHQRPQQYRNKSKVFTPRTPEIKEWTEKEKRVPQAPIKSQGRRPVLMLDDKDGKTKTSRKLELEEEETEEQDQTVATTTEESTSS